jgi:hypothetical protein
MVCPNGFTVEKPGDQPEEELPFFREEPDYCPTFTVAKI